MRSIPKLLLWTTPVWLAFGCGADGNETPTDADSEADSVATTDTDTESESASESETDPSTACLDTISGRVVIDGADPLPVTVYVCIGVCFSPFTTDDDGFFEWQLPAAEDGNCVSYVFEDTPLHINFRVIDAPESFAEYAFSSTPSQSEISDLGDDDFDLDLGDLKMYALPEAAAVFSPETGAEVSSVGVSFSLEKDALVKYDGDAELPPTEDQSLYVFKAPLEEWDPPFAPTTLNALYFLGPRWAKLTGNGVPLSIEAPDDLSEGDEVTVYLLAGFVSEWGDESIVDTPDFLYLDTNGRCINDNGSMDLTFVDEGVFQDCGRVSVENGLIITPPIPRLTWVGIGR